MVRSPIDHVTTPVIPGMNADPSLRRAGREYFPLTGGNDYMPGLPLHRWIDPVSWVQVGKVITCDSQLNRGRDLNVAPYADDGALPAVFRACHSGETAVAIDAAPSEGVG